MKNISIPVYINRFLMFITVALYFTIIFGLYAQVVLGAFQVLTGFILLFFLDRIPTGLRNHLLCYWGLTLVYGAFCLISRFEGLGDIGFIMIILIPMSIAGYFTYILESLKNKKL